MFLPLDHLKSRIFRLNRKLNDFEWGIVVGGKPVTNEDKIDWDDYRTLSCKDFLKYRIGTCWDYTNYEGRHFLKHFSDYFTLTEKMFSDTEKNDSLFSLYYMEFDDGDHTRLINHTWLAYYLEGFCCSFESSWKAYMGITKFRSEQEMLDTYMERQILSEENQGYSITEPRIYKYKPSPSGMTAWNFIDRIRKEGNLIFS